MARMTFRQVNAALRAAGYAEELVQGNGYLYFVGGDAAGWYSSTIAVCRLNHLRDVQEVLDERNELAGNYHNMTRYSK